MRYRSSILALGAVALGLALEPSAVAQVRRGGMGRGARAPRIRLPQKGPRTPIQEFETMPPEEQRNALNRLPPGERRKLQERLDRFNQLPEDQRRTLDEPLQSAAPASCRAPGVGSKGHQQVFRTGSRSPGRDPPGTAAHGGTSARPTPGAREELGFPLDLQQEGAGHPARHGAAAARTVARIQFYGKRHGSLYSR